MRTCRLSLGFVQSAIYALGTLLVHHGKYWQCIAHLAGEVIAHMFGNHRRSVSVVGLCRLDIRIAKIFWTSSDAFFVRSTFSQEHCLLVSLALRCTKQRNPPAAVVLNKQLSAQLLQSIPALFCNVWRSGTSRERHDFCRMQAFAKTHSAHILDDEHAASCCI